MRTGSLDGPGPLRDRIASLLRRAVEPDVVSDRPRGCFACNAAVELGPDDERVRSLVSGSFRGIRAVLRDALMAARDGGELPPDADVDALAGMLLAVLEGLHVLAKGTGDRRLLEQAISGAVSVL